MATSDVTLQQRDNHLVAYLQSYEDYLTSQLELQAALKEGFFLLSKARRDLSRSRNTGTPCIGALQYPQEIEAIARLSCGPDEPPHGPELHVVRRAPEAATVDAKLLPSSGQKAAGAVSARTQEQQLRELGIGAALSREIASSLQDSEEPVGVMCGNTLVVDGGSDESGMRSCAMSSDITMAPSGLSSLKDAQFQSLLREDDGAQPRPAPQRPSPANDPVRWFSVMPPPALRKSQASFQRTVELVAHVVNLQQRMLAARALYDGCADVAK